jgi:5'-3' exonuclease
MGIPSYYKKLADYTKGLVSKSFDGNAEALYFDFNCMIYHCARRQNSTLPPYPGLDQQEEWEALLLEDIVKYVVKVWQMTGKPKEVFLGIDGVVPMAKIKQQRMRRFKSVWLTQKEKEEGIRDNKESWDTNCITPGTKFMARLTRRLQDLCSKHTGWSVSGADEPGEGEHKVMNLLRQRGPNANPLLIYGLDADLILLTLLNAKGPAYLVREASEMGIVQLDTFGEEQLTYFSIPVLEKTLPPGLDKRTYIAMMSLLGNDFVPHSLTVKIRDDGHSRLLKSLTEVKDLVVEDNNLLRVNYDALLQLLRTWSLEEEDRILHTFKKKMQMRGRTQMTLDVKPLEWMVEDGLAFKEQGTWKVSSRWKSVYQKDWLQCETQTDTFQVCREYLYGLQWVFDYYTGQTPVNLSWSYSRLLPPLWSDLVQYLETQVYEPFESHQVAVIQPEEQLAMVLPLESWHYITNPSFRSLPMELPQFWPKSFGFFSAGRIRLWECEAWIPPLTIQRLRDALKEREECGMPK